MLTGNGGANELDGGQGADTMSGGLGDDLYYVDSAGDVVIEAGGRDTIRSTVSYVLPTGVENLELTGGQAINAAGNELGNLLTGNSAANVLDGKAGADTMSGGGGDDTYVVDIATDMVNEQAGQGLDTVQSWISYALRPNVENLLLLGSGAINGTGNDMNNLITGNTGNNILDGGAGVDTLAGGRGDDIYLVTDALDTITENADEGIDLVRSSLTHVLRANVENLTLTGNGAINGTGNALGNLLTGNSQNNVLDGAAGADTMIGGAGDDGYVVDSADDVVIEAMGTGTGTDTVTSSFSYTLSANVEKLVLRGPAAVRGTGNAGANVITGNELANLLDGAAGADTMIGGSGDDTYIVDSATDVVVEAAEPGIDTVRASTSYTLSSNVENIVLTGGSATNATGNAMNNVLTGNDANNILDGGAGADTMSGGRGDDSYVIDQLTDVVIEAADQGLDTVRSRVNHTLNANFENLILLGAATIGTGNSADNVLTGNELANTLDGGAGADVFWGGRGDDTYVVDDLRDLVNEAAGEGTDTVRSSVSHTLRTNVENLILTGQLAINGTGNLVANVLTGNGMANELDGGAGADTMSGGDGNDLYYVDNAGDVVNETATGGLDTVISSLSHALRANVENLTLTGQGNLNAMGNGQDNVLTGNAGDNELDGGLGADTMSGGLGDDVYSVDSVRDVVIETAGRDTIRSSVSYVLPTGVETIRLLDGQAINATGNEQGNVLLGNSSANVLDGGAGADTMSGGPGDDTYIVDIATDVVNEQLGEGLDTVQSWISHMLRPNVENLILLGTGASNGTGNELNNVITGNAGNNQLDGGLGNDILIGGAGNDLLTGGGGNDRFVFARNFGADRINDFAAGAASGDVLALSLGPSYDSFAEVMAAGRQVNADSVFDFGDLGSLVLRGTTLTALAWDDFAYA